VLADADWNHAAMVDVVVELGLKKLRFVLVATASSTRASASLAAQSLGRLSACRE
jgi:hypothetical protein